MGDFLHADADGDGDALRVGSGRLYARIRSVFAFSLPLVRRTYREASGKL